MTSILSVPPLTSRRARPPQSPESREPSRRRSVMHSSARAPEQSRTRSPDGPRLKGKDVGIPVRKLGLPYGADMPTYWFANNAFLTSYFSAFSATLPDGEAQFIHSVRLFKDKITDPVLQAQIRGFIGQEVHHAKEHEAFNAAMVARGIPLDVIERFVVGINEWVRENQPPVAQLASTV